MRPERPLDAAHAEAVHDVVRQTERHHLGHRQAQARVKQVAEVDLDVGACGHVDQQVVAVAVAEADDVAGERPGGGGVRERRPRL